MSSIVTVWKSKTKFGVEWTLANKMISQSTILSLSFSYPLDSLRYLELLFISKYSSRDATRLFSFISAGTINFNNIPQPTNCIVPRSSFIIFIRFNSLKGISLCQNWLFFKICDHQYIMFEKRLQTQKSYFIINFIVER